MDGAETVGEYLTRCVGGCVRGGAGRFRTGLLGLGGESPEDLDVGLDGDVADEDEVPPLSLRDGAGAIGVMNSVARFRGLKAGYPLHVLPDFTQLLHCGLVSSHLTLRFL